MTLTGLPLSADRLLAVHREGAVGTLYTDPDRGRSSFGPQGVMAWRNLEGRAGHTDSVWTLIGWAAFGGPASGSSSSNSCLLQAQPTGWGLKEFPRVVVEPKTGRQLFIYHEVKRFRTASSASRRGSGKEVLLSEGDSISSAQMDSKVRR